MARPKGRPIKVDGRPARLRTVEFRFQLDNIQKAWTQTIQEPTEARVRTWEQVDPNNAVHVDREPDVLTIWTTGGHILRFVLDGTEPNA